MELGKLSDLKPVVERLNAIRDAANRLRVRRGKSFDLSYPLDSTVSTWAGMKLQEAQQDQDAYRVADAYLDELDPTPIDREFAELLGWLKDGPDTYVRSGQLLEFRDGVWKLWGPYPTENPTRGLIRTLLRLMNPREPCGPS